MSPGVYSVLLSGKNSDEGVFLSSILEHSATSLKLHELFPHYHLYPVCEEGGGGGIHSIKIRWLEGVICLSIHTQDSLLVA